MYFVSKKRFHFYFLSSIQLQSFILNETERFIWYIIYNAIRQPIIVVEVTRHTRHVSIKCQAAITPM